MADSEKDLMLAKAFKMFDQGKTGFIDAGKISTILNTIGSNFDEDELSSLITAANEADPEKNGKLNFETFLSIAGHFMEEELNEEQMAQELKEAFRLYDREGNGYITTGTLREILQALDDKLGPEDLDGIIEEIDTDGSGTVDFDEFMEMMTGE